MLANSALPAVRSDDEGGFLHADVREMILPRLALDEIATVLEKLEHRAPASEP